MTQNQENNTICELSLQEFNEIKKRGIVLYEPNKEYSSNIILYNMPRKHWLTKKLITEKNQSEPLNITMQVRGNVYWSSGLGLLKLDIKNSNEIINDIENSLGNALFYSNRTEPVRSYIKNSTKPTTNINYQHVIPDFNEIDSQRPISVEIKGSHKEWSPIVNGLLSKYKKS